MIDNSANLPSFFLRAKRILSTNFEKNRERYHLPTSRVKSVLKLSIETFPIIFYRSESIIKNFDYLLSKEIALKNVLQRNPNPLLYFPARFDRVDN